MHCLAKASAFALLLAPALAGAVAPPEPREEAATGSTSSAYIVFDLPDDFPADHLDFSLSVAESREPCDRANVRINNQVLPEGGSGTFTARQDTSFSASWKLSCVDAEGTAAKEQLMSLSVDSVSGVPVSGMGISLRLQPVAPMAISGLKGPASMALFGGRDPPASPESTPDRLTAELDEVDTLRSRAAEIHRLIGMRERMIDETYGWTRGNTGGRSIKDCDSIGCVIKTLYDNASGAAASLLRGGHDGHRRHRWRGPPRWWRHRHHRHPGHGWCGHGNHTHPPPHFRHGPHPGPPGGHRPPPHRPEHPPPPPGWDEPEGPPPPPPPPSSHSDPKVAPMSGTDEWNRPQVNYPLHGFEGGPPPPHGPPAGGPGGHHGGPPPPPPHGGPRGHGRERWFSLLIKVALCSVTLGVLVAVMHQRCRKKRAIDGRTWLQRLMARREARRRRRAERKAAVKRFFARLTAPLRWLVNGLGDEEKEAILQQQRRERSGSGGRDLDLETTVEEEIAGLRVAADVVSDMIAAEEGRVRMQQQRQMQQVPPQAPLQVNIAHVSHRLSPPPPPPPPPANAFANFAPQWPSRDSYESLPAYEATVSPPAPQLAPAPAPAAAAPCVSQLEIDEEEEDSSVSSLVADGFMYTPGSSEYTPGSRGSSVAGQGSADALGDTKS